MKVFLKFLPISALTVIFLVGLAYLLKNEYDIVPNTPSGMQSNLFFNKKHDKPKIRTEQKDSLIPKDSSSKNQTNNKVDLAIIDSITNDTVIWEEGYLTFIPIIKNIGTKTSGTFQVIYYLNGSHSSSFELTNLDPGEYVNTFIAGTGFKGNFGPKKKPEMELKVVVQPLKSKDVNKENNEYTWKFKYLETPQPKHTCTYKDNNQGPEDFYTKTSINYSGKLYHDRCLDEKHLLEYNCDEHPVYKGDKNIDTFLYKCAKGCSEGACEK